MNGGDKLLSRIKSDCDESVRAIEAKSAETCSGILAQAQKQGEKSADEILRKAQAKVEQINASSKSRAELETRNALLKRRRSEIDKTLDGLLDYLVNLSDNEYFEYIYKLAAKLSGKKGMVHMNQRDLDRMPLDFILQLAKNGLIALVSKTPVDIAGGFILKSGDIEENMDFSALIAAKRDEIEDKINRELFAE